MGWGRAKGATQKTKNGARSQGKDITLRLVDACCGGYNTERGGEMGCGEAEAKGRGGKREGTRKDKKGLGVSVIFSLLPGKDWWRQNLVDVIPSAPTYLPVCLYVCMYVCMYICLCICMYTYMYVYMFVCMYVCMFLPMHLRRIFVYREREQ